MFIYFLTNGMAVSSIHAFSKRCSFSFIKSIASSIDDTIEMRKEMLSMHARHYCAVSLTDMELSSNLLKAVYNCEQGRRVDLEIESGEPCAISCMSGLVGLREKIKVNKAKDRI